MLPLYDSIARWYQANRRLEGANLSLVFDKFVDTWPGTAPGERDGADFKKPFLEKLQSRKPDRHQTEMLHAHIERRRRHVGALGGVSLTACTETRLVSGLGAAHPLESGFVWHRTLGLPYLPGTSLKGLMRAWADPKRGWGGCPDPEQVEYLFGNVSEQHRGAGALIVFDALPTEPPRLELDILNVHYQKYYQGKLPPADYQSPVPVYFLVVAPGATFELALAPRRRNNSSSSDLADGVRLLTEALATLGAGAKTALGYGRLSVQSSETARAEGAQAAPAESPMVVAWRERIAGYRSSDYSSLSSWVEQISRLEDPAAKKDLAEQLWSKVFTNEKIRRKAEGKGWYQKLMEMKDL